MRTSLLGAVMCVAIVAACLVDRPSETFHCGTTADCESPRQCQSGFCVVPNCPDDCTTCDEGAKTCLVECASADDCDGTITCPAGWACTVNCVGAGACNDIECQSGSECLITCSGTDACDDVRCTSACKCDLTCAAGACSSKSCPTVGNGSNLMNCTSDGTTATQCDSAHAAGCAKC